MFDARTPVDRSRNVRDTGRFSTCAYIPTGMNSLCTLTAPKGRRMGHAGAIISATGDSAAEKAEIMRSYGLTVAPSPGDFGSTVEQVMRKIAA